MFVNDEVAFSFSFFYSLSRYFSLSVKNVRIFRFFPGKKWSSKIMITTRNEKVVMKRWLKVKSNEKTCQTKWTDQKVDGTKNGLMKMMDSTRERESNGKASPYHSLSLLCKCTKFEPFRSASRKVINGPKMRQNFLISSFRNSLSLFPTHFLFLSLFLTHFLSPASLQVTKRGREWNELTYIYL